MHACVHAHACVLVHVCSTVEFRGQLGGGISFFVLPCGSWGSNSGSQVWDKKFSCSVLIGKSLL